MTSHVNDALATRAQPCENRLKDRIEELEETIVQLREQLIPTLSWPHELGLTRSESAILSFLYKRSPMIATKEQLFEAFYPDPDNEPGERAVFSHICRLRPKLAEFGVRLHTHRCEGFSVERRYKAVLAAMLDGEAPRRVAPRDHWRRAYPARPGSGPDGEMCRTCAHMSLRKKGNHRESYYRCMKMQPLWVATFGSDIRPRAPACEQWTARTGGEPE